ncbi:unnamed protein product [Rotaria magnacalcarata]|uniref:TTF-type domain-containing protein n=2 Tax=Rotaria magnacalcarata TaxID=392030 RepID=A0A816SA23_9BILA|nr:unnamed protein product [Rotaria magnacalcarata]
MMNKKQNRTSLFHRLYQQLKSKILLVLLRCIAINLQPIVLFNVRLRLSKSCNDAPVQKKLATYPANQQNRSFQSTWFNDRIWLEYSVLNDASYCYYCRHFPSNQLNADDSLTTVGFNSWKKALDKGSGFIKHASSQAHIIATKNYLTYKQQQGANSNVLKQLDSCRAIQIRRNRDSMTKICSTLRFLARQMIGFRGHEENEKCVDLTIFEKDEIFLLRESNK